VPRLLREGAGQISPLGRFAWREREERGSAIKRKGWVLCIFGQNSIVFLKKFKMHTRWVLMVPKCSEKPKVSSANV
jgi:hypothetical protein